MLGYLLSDEGRPPPKFLCMYMYVYVCMCICMYRFNLLLVYKYFSSVSFLGRECKNIFSRWLVEMLL